MTRNEVYVNIARNVLTHLPPAEESVLACMITLHTHDIILADSCNPTDMTSVGERRKLSAVTRRHAAEIVAAATGNATDQPTIDYWYARYSSRTPYEVVEDLPQALMSQVLGTVTAMKTSPLVQDIIEAE